jgi:hypothetical protein
MNYLALENVVRPSGFEPLAFCSGGKRSIQAELRAREHSGYEDRCALAILLDPLLRRLVELVEDKSSITR